jgi:hypothetical protein
MIAAFSESTMTQAATFGLRAVSSPRPPIRKQGETRMTKPERNAGDDLQEECLGQFSRLVESVGVKRFAVDMSLSTRHVNRILSGTHPNPVHRLIRSLQCSDAQTGDEVLDFICQELGGHFVRHEALDEAAVNAVKECAEAIAAISDGKISDLAVKEIREAISALSGIILALRETTAGAGSEGHSPRPDRRRPDSADDGPPPG